MSKASTATPKPTDMLRERDAAELLGIGYRTLQAWRLRGEGPRYVKYPGRMGAVRYRRSDLDAFVNENLRQTA